MWSAKSTNTTSQRGKSSWTSQSQKVLQCMWASSISKRSLSKMIGRELKSWAISIPENYSTQSVKDLMSMKSSGAVKSMNCKTASDTTNSMSQMRASSSISKSSTSRLSLLLRSKTLPVHSRISSGIAKNPRQQDGGKSCRPSDKARDTKNT